MVYQRYQNRDNSASAQKSATPLTSGAYFDAPAEKVLNRAGQWVAEHRSRRARHARNIPNMQRIRHAKPNKITIYADMLKLTCSDLDRGISSSDKRGGGLRGNIRGFSRASRKRMIEFMASIRNAGSMMFLTMTLPDDFPPDDPEAWHADFEAFRHRFQRAYPAYAALWRMELVERKSGTNQGFIAPHYHMIIFTMRKVTDEQLETDTADFWAWASNNWFEIANYEDENHLQHGAHCTPVRSRKHATSYVSKYVGKLSGDNIEAGRRWGRIGKLDTSAGETFRLNDDEYTIFRRLVKRWLRNRNREYAKTFARNKYGAIGFTIFGLGDVLLSGDEADIFAGYWQFVHEARRQAKDIRERERGHGN